MTDNASPSAAIRAVVEGQLRGEGPPPREMALRIVQSAIARFRPASTDDHGGYWNGSVWLNEFRSHHQREGVAELEHLVNELGAAGTPTTCSSAGARSSTGPKATPSSSSSQP